MNQQIVVLSYVTLVEYVLLFIQGGTCKNACQTQRPRGHARRDGAHPHSHPGRRPASPCAMETETSKVIQCKTQKAHRENV